MLILAGIITWRYHPSSIVLQEYRQSWVRLITSCALVLSVLVFARWQGLAFLSIRVMQGGLAFVFTVISMYYVVQRVFVFPKKIHAEYAHNTLNMYLPKPKRK